MCTWAQEAGGELSRARDAFTARRGRGGPEPTRVSVLSRARRAGLAPVAGGCGAAVCGGAPGGGPAAEGLRRRRRFYLRPSELRAISERLRAPARPGPRSAAAAGGGGGGSEEGVKPAASGSDRRGLRGAAPGGGGSRSGRRQEGGTDELAAALAVARDGEISCHPDVSVMLAQTRRDLAAAKQRQQRREEEEREQPLARR